MLPKSWGYGLYLFLYTLVWLSLTTIIYRFLFVGSSLHLKPTHFFFLVGLLLLVCGALRSWRPREWKDSRHDPITLSFGLSGLLLILFANLAW